MPDWKGLMRTRKGLKSSRHTSRHCFGWPFSTRSLKWPSLKNDLWENGLTRALSLRTWTTSDHYPLSYGLSNSKVCPSTLMKPRPERITNYLLSTWKPDMASNLKQHVDSLGKGINSLDDWKLNISKVLDELQGATVELHLVECNILARMVVS